MAKMSLSSKIFCAAIVILVVAAPATEAITCSDVARSVGSCLPYVNNGGTPSTACCNGVRSLNSAARSTPDRQAVCVCLKTLLRNPGNSASLPGMCRVSIPYKISPSTNCATVK